MLELATATMNALGGVLQVAAGGLAVVLIAGQFRGGRSWRRSRPEDESD